MKLSVGLRAFPIAMLLATACGKKPDPPVGKTVSLGAACVARPGGSRWVGEYTAVSVFGDSEGEEMSGIMLAGIAATDSMVYVMESDRAALWLLQPDLSLVRRVGREGGGPGEWRPGGPANQGGSMRWLHASGDRVRLFEGERVQELDRNGRFRRVLVNGAIPAGISPLQSRLAFVGDTLLYSTGGYDLLLAVLQGENLVTPRSGSVGGESIWTVQMRVGEETRPVLRLGLVPVDPKQGPGPAQALPLWDTDGRCVVASNGAEPLLVYAPLEGGKQDTVGISLPNRAARADDYARQLGGVLPPGMRVAQPSAAARVRDLVIDPDGIVWILPVQPRDEIPGGVEVVRTPLGGGQVVMDTVPAFPRAFGIPGVYYAEADGPDGEILVVRYDRAGREQEIKAGESARP